jgi:photosystem II stability/assembly factor-like uncharacterized protein
MDARTHLLLGAAAACLLLSSAATPALAQGAPGSSSSWTGGGPDLGFVNAIRRASPGGPVYAGTYGGGIFRSDDGGLSWSDFSFGTVDDAIVLEIETATRGAEELVYIATENSGLWRWRSGIGLWEGLNSGMGGQGPLGVRGLAIHPNDPKVLTVATTAGIFTSNDGGRTWPDSLRWLEGSTFEDVAVSPRAPNTIFGLESFSLFETQDKGDHLIDLGAGLPFHFNWDFEFHRDSLDSLLVLTLDDGLYLSTQRDPFARIGPTQNQAAGIRSYDLEITRRDGALLVGSERGLHVSQDMGQSWLKHNAYQETIALPEIWAIWIEAERPLELFLGSFRSGFMRTGLGLDDWQESNQGLRAAWIEGLHAWEGNVVATTAHGRVFHSTDFAQSWVERTGDLDAIRQNDFHRFPGGERWLLASVSGVWLSDDLGQHWRLPAVPVAESCRRFLHPAWEPEGTLYVTTFKGVWKAVDAGETWLRVGEGLPAAGNFQAAGAASGDQTVFFGALGDAIYRSVAGSPFQALPNSAYAGAGRPGPAGPPPRVRQPRSVADHARRKRASAHGHEVGPATRSQHGWPRCRDDPARSCRGHLLCRAGRRWGLAEQELGQQLGALRRGHSRPTHRGAGVRGGRAAPLRRYRGFGRLRPRAPHGGGPPRRRPAAGGDTG